MWKEFREFIARGNVIDLAVGIIIGAAFTKIVDSLVADLIMPVVGFIFGGLDFSNYYINLSGQQYPSYGAAKEAGAAVIGYGAFITAIISFLIVAFVIFMMVKGINQLRREEATKEGPPPAPTSEEKLLGEIRDLIRDGRTYVRGAD